MGGGRKGRKNEFSRERIAELLGVGACPVDAKNTPLVVIKTRVVPRGVLPDDVVGTIHTLTAAPCRQNGIVMRRNARASDDNAYKNHPHLQRQLPRGLSVLEIRSRGGATAEGAKGTDLQLGDLLDRQVMHGFYKFGGSALDEDSHVATEGLYQLTDLSNASRVIVTEKANGKAAWLTMFRFRRRVFVFGGSKSDHHVIPMDSFDTYVDRIGDKSYAKPILRCFHRQFRRLSEQHKLEFMARLIGTDDRCGDTLCGEYEDGMHMVPLAQGQSPVLRFFGFVKKRGAVDIGDPNETLCEDAVRALEYLRQLGFEVIRVVVRTPEDMRRHKMRLRTGRGLEGFVLHWQCEVPDHPGRFRTVAVEKFKTWWYVIVRVIRQFLLDKNQHGSNWESKMLRRFLARNEGFLHLPEGMLKLWLDLGLRFVDWFVQKHGWAQVGMVGISEGCTGMATMWARYIEETGLDDDFDLPEEEVQKRGLQHFKLTNGTAAPLNKERAKRSLKQRERNAALTNVKTGYLQERPLLPGMTRRQVRTAPAKGVLVLFQGIPGLGKSFIANALLQKFRDYEPVAIEQDAFAKYGKKQAGRKCREEVERLMAMHSGSSLKLIFLQRNNAEPRQYNSYIGVAQKHRFVTVAVAPRNLEQCPAMVLPCLQSVLQRESHATFDAIDLKKRLQLTLAFATLFEPARESADIHTVARVDWFDQAALEAACPPEAVEAVRAYMAHCDEARTPFDAPALPAKQVIDDMSLNSFDYQRFRRTPAQVAAQTAEALLPLLRDASSLNVAVDEGQQLHEQRANKVVFYGVFWDDADARERVLHETKAMLDAELDLDDFPTEKADHVTLAHKSSARTQADVWQRCGALAAQQQQVTVTLRSVAVSQRAVCLRASLALPDGTSLDDCVTSQVPHTTVLLRKRVSPVESGDVCRLLDGQPCQNSSAEAHGQVRELRFEEPLLLRGTVRAFPLSNRNNNNNSNNNNNNNNGKAEDGDERRPRRRGGRHRRRRQTGRRD